MSIPIILIITAVWIQGFLTGRFYGVRCERRAFAAAYGNDPPPEPDDEPDDEPDPAILARYAVGDPVWIQRDIDAHTNKRYPRTVVDVLPDGLVISGNPDFATTTHDPNVFFYDIKAVATRVWPRHVKGGPQRPIDETVDIGSDI